MKPHSQKPTWSKQYRIKIWIGYTTLFFIFSAISFLVALYHYNRVGYIDWRGYFNFYLILGIFYVFSAISSLVYALSLISNRKTRKKIIYLGGINLNFFLEVEGMVNYYLKVNEGKTYTTEALISELEYYFKSNKKKEYYRNNIETILSLMVQRGTIQQVQENGKIHYSF